MLKYCQVSATAHCLLPADNASVLGNVQKGQIRTAPLSGVQLANLQEQQSRSRLYSDQVAVSRIPKPPTVPQAELMSPQKLTGRIGSDHHQSSLALADRPISSRDSVERQATSHTSSSSSLLPRSNPTTEDTSLGNTRATPAAPKPASCSQGSVPGCQEQPAGTAGQAPGLSRLSAPVPQEATSPSTRSDASLGRPLSKAGPLTSSGGFAIGAALRNVLNRTRFSGSSLRSPEAAEARLRLRMNTSTQIPMPVLPMDPPTSKLAPPATRVISPEPERPSAFSRRLHQPSKPMPALERVAVPGELRSVPPLTSPAVRAAVRAGVKTQLVDAAAASRSGGRGARRMPVSTEIVPDAAPPLPQPGMLHRPASRAPTQHRPAARAPTRPAELTVSPFRRRTVAEVYAQTRAAWEVRHESAEKESAAARAGAGLGDSAMSSPPVASQRIKADTDRADAPADGSETAPGAAGSLKAGTNEKAEVLRQHTGAAPAEARDHKGESTSSQQHQTPQLLSTAAALRLNPQSAASTPLSAASPRPPGLASDPPSRLASAAGTAGDSGATVATSFRRPRSAVAAHPAGRGAPTPLPRQSAKEASGSSVAATASQVPAAQPGARDSAVSSLKRVPASGLSQLELPIKPSPGPAGAAVASLGAAPGLRVARPAVPAAVALQRSQHPGPPATADAVEAEHAQGTRADGLPAAVGQASSLPGNPSAYAADQAAAKTEPAAAAGAGAAAASQGLTAQDNPLFNAPSASLADADVMPTKPAASVPAPPGIL